MMKPNDQYAGFVEMLRSPAMAHYEYDADQGAILCQAADILEAVLADRDALKAENNELREENELVGKQMDKFADQIEALEAERDALLARLAPEDDEALVEIAADAISTYVCDQVSKWGSIKDAAIDAIAAIRPHIEAAERERCAKIAERKKKQKYYDPNSIGWEGEWEIVDEFPKDGKEIAAAIRSGI